jgi:nitrite reductase/ring-hydroxylating ferredoxin subunit
VGNKEADVAEAELNADDDACWFKVAERDRLTDGQIMRVEAAGRFIALSLIDGEYGAIDDDCPHQGGPLAEGTIDEDGKLRCPWHGWAFCRCTGEGPRGINVNGFRVENRDDGIYVAVSEQTERHHESHHVDDGI